MESDFERNGFLFDNFGWFSVAVVLIKYPLHVLGKLEFKEPN